MSRHTHFVLFLLFLVVNAPAGAMVPEPQALRETGIRLADENREIPEYRRAFKSFCLAALEGDGRAAYHLGSLYLEGKGQTADDARAAGWFKQAEQLGDPDAAGVLEARLASVTPADDPRCPLVTPRPGKRQIATWVHLLAPYYKLNPGLVLSVIRVESNFMARAQSPKNAMGLMQLLPATAERFDVKDIWHPLENLKGGMAYLAWLKAHFQEIRGRKPSAVVLAIAAYNAGEEAVKRHGGIPPYDETRKYVKRVVGTYAKYLRARKGRSHSAGKNTGNKRTRSRDATMKLKPNSEFRTSYIPLSSSR